jgi:hypothetical protein
VIDLRRETDALASWPTDERLRALQRIIPQARVEEVLAQTGHDRRMCKRLPGWFMVWFMIALGLCCRDCYRQIFRWLQPFRPGTVPGRSTLCEARKRLGVAPLRVLAEQVIRLLGRPDTPGAFYRGMRLMAGQSNGLVRRLPYSDLHMNGVQISGSLHLITRLCRTPRKCKPL